MTLREWLDQAPFALAMSSGFFGFFAHTGLLSVLEEQGLHPVAISGSSAGALAGGLWAAGLNTREMVDRLTRLQRDDFWDPFPGFGLLRGRRFRRELEAILPVQEFEDCRVPFRLSVFDLYKRKTRVIDSGLLAPAIQASCALPFLFQPAWLNRRPSLDGGIKDRPGIAGLRDEERIFYHHLSSRSPWRAENGAQTVIPERVHLRALVINNLPRVTPFTLESGMIAYRHARKATERALDRPLRGRVIHV